MHRTIISAFSAIAAAAMLVAGCASNAPSTENYSGFLKDYSNLQETKDPAGEPILRYVNPKLNPANYSAVMIEPVVVYPDSEPTDQLSQATMDQIRGYLTASLRQAISSKAQVVEAPGPGVAKLQIAITGVASSKEGLKPYQIVPTALVATMAVRTVAGSPYKAKLLIEGLGTDSVTGEVLLKTVRSQTGERLQRVSSNEPVITFDAVKPIIDDWADQTAAQVAQFVKPR